MLKSAFLLGLLFHAMQNQFPSLLWNATTAALRYVVHFV